MILGAAINYLMACMAARSILPQRLRQLPGGEDDLSSRLRHYTCGSGRTHARLHAELMAINV